MHFDEVNVLFLVEKLQIKTWNKWRNIEYLREKTLKRIRKTIIRKLLLDFMAIMSYYTKVYSGNQIRNGGKE